MSIFFRKSFVLPTVSFAVFAVVGLVFVGCGLNEGSKTETSAVSNATRVTLGEPPKEDAPLVCAGCVSEGKLGQTVAIEGRIIQQCPAIGCWFRMKDDVGEVFVDLAPAKLRLTEKREGQHAKVTGRVVKQGGQFRLEAQYVEFESAKQDAPSSEQ